MGQSIGKEIEAFVKRAETMGVTPVLKLFMIPTAELKKTRCEICGRSMLVNLRGTSRPVCWDRACASHALDGEQEQASTLYHVFPPRAKRE